MRLYAIVFTSSGFLKQSLSYRVFWCTCGVRISACYLSPLLSPTYSHHCSHHLCCHPCSHPLSLLPPLLSATFLAPIILPTHRPSLPQLFVHSVFQSLFPSTLAHRCSLLKQRGRHRMAELSFSIVLIVIESCTYSIHRRLLEPWRAVLKNLSVLGGFDPDSLT